MIHHRSSFSERLVGNPGFRGKTAIPDGIPQSAPHSRWRIVFSELRRHTRQCRRVTTASEGQSMQRLLFCALAKLFGKLLEKIMETHAHDNSPVTLCPPSALPLCLRPRTPLSSRKYTTTCVPKQTRRRAAREEGQGGQAGGNGNRSSSASDGGKAVGSGGTWEGHRKPQEKGRRQQRQARLICLCVVSRRRITNNMW